MAIHRLMAAGPSLLSELRRLVLFRSFFTSSTPFSRPPVYTEEFEVGSRGISFNTGAIRTSASLVGDLDLSISANSAVEICTNGMCVLSTVYRRRICNPSPNLSLTVNQSDHADVLQTHRKKGAHMIHNTIRTLFPHGFYHEVQVRTSILRSVESDLDCDYDVMAANATSAALMMSDIPWAGPIGVMRVGRIGGSFVLNPTIGELKVSDINLIYACTKDRTLMIDMEGGAISDRDLQICLKLAHSEAVKYIPPQIRLAKKAGMKKHDFKLFLTPDKCTRKIKILSEAPIEKVFNDHSYFQLLEIEKAFSEIAENVKVQLLEDGDLDALEYVASTMRSLMKQVILRRIFEKGLRVDGRQLDEVRPVYYKTNLYPTLHGSSHFILGNSEATVTVTRGTPDDAEFVQLMTGPTRRWFKVCYHLPLPFLSDEEVPDDAGLNTGSFVERALVAALPQKDLQYSAEVDSWVMPFESSMESHGPSTCIVTTCGGSLALMEAGILVGEHVAGVSVGLVSELDPATGNMAYRLLTDILGIEKNIGDMCLIVLGTKKRITGVQLDLKSAGIPLEVILKGLEAARKGRNIMIEKMEEISAPA